MRSLGLVGGKTYRRVSRPAENTLVTQLSFDTGAASYDRRAQLVSAPFIPALLVAARVGPGQRVLDVGTGTGIAARAAAQLVGPSGSVLAVDISVPMLSVAKELPGRLPVRVVAMNGEALAYREAAFDAVISSLSLQHFPDPARGLGEFRRVLRPGGRVAVSVTGKLERTVYGRVFESATRYLPRQAGRLIWDFELGDRLEGLLTRAGFLDVSVIREVREAVFASFDEYWSHIEAGGGLSGAAYKALPDAARQAVQEEVRESLLPYQRTGRLVIEAESVFGLGRR